MVLTTGRNHFDGIPVEVVRKRIRRINLRIGSDGIIYLSIPKWWATIAEGEAFLRSKWKWAVKTRAEILANPPARRPPPTQEMLASLDLLIRELHTTWTLRLGEAGVTWKMRSMKTLWGSCHFRKRHITYNTDLAAVPRELVEYVVVHELTHLKVHNHGPEFYALMDERLPGWKLLRRRLARWGSSKSTTEPDSGTPN